MTQLTAHFSLEELTTTEIRSADNHCPADLMAELLETALMMERIRSALSAAHGGDVAIFVTSGFRSPAVNARVGGSATSDHMKAAAVDFKAPEFGTPYRIAQFLAGKMDALGIGQVIHEYGRWVHVSRKPPDKILNRAITVSYAGTQAGIVEVA